MRFSCEDCGSRYSTRRELAPGRAFKFTCKTCGKAMLVRPDAVRNGADRGPQAMPAVPAVAGATSAAKAKAPAATVRPDDIQALRCALDPFAAAAAATTFIDLRLDDDEPAAPPRPEPEHVAREKVVAECGPAVEPRSVATAGPAAGARPVAEPGPAAEARPVAEAGPVAEARPAAEARPVAEARPAAEAKAEEAPTPVPRTALRHLRVGTVRKRRSVTRAIAAVSLAGLAVLGSAVFALTERGGVSDARPPPAPASGASSGTAVDAAPPPAAPRPGLLGAEPIPAPAADKSEKGEKLAKALAAQATVEKATSGERPGKAERTVRASAAPRSSARAIPSTRESLPEDEEAPSGAPPPSAASAAAAPEIPAPAAAQAPVQLASLSVPALGGTLAREAQAEPEEAPRYALDGFRRPAPVEPDCVREHLRLPKDAPSGLVTLRFAVGRDGAVDQVAVHGNVQDPRITAAAKAAVRSCRFTPGADAEGKPTKLWVVLPLRFVGG